MKKKSYLAITLILSLLSLQIISAQQPEEIINDTLTKNVLEGTQKLANFSAQENKSAYLSQEWTNLLQKNKAFNRRRKSEKIGN